MKKEEKKQQYILCPRCELNYITAKEKYCTVCKAEMGLVDPSILLPDDEEVGLEKLCPVCHVNYIGEDEEICFLCQKERDERKSEEEKDEWAGMDEDTEDIESPIGILPLEDDGLFASDDEPEEDDDETVRTEGDDDFDYVSPDEDFDDEDFDDDDEDFDDEEEDLD